MRAIHSFAVAFVVPTVACSVSASTSVPADLVGQHCIASDPFAYFYQKEPHTDAEIRARRAFARRAEAIRFSVGPDGAITVTGADGEVHTGRITATTQRGPNWGAAVAWTATPPSGAILGGTQILLQAGKYGYMLHSTGVEPGASADDWYQVLDTEGCWEPDLAALRGDTAPTPPPDIQAAEAWIGGEWPQLVLTNAITFRDGRSTEGASSFLVETSNGVRLATAAHLVGPAGGIEPAVPLSSLDTELKEWDAFVRTRPQPRLSARGFALTSTSDEVVNDWLFLKVDRVPPGLAQPLHLRDTPVAVGERVQLVGCQYRDQACTQHAYGGRVSGRNGHMFRYDLDEPVELAGFSGAPILDAHGLVVGVMSVAFTTYDQGDAQLEGGGRDASAVRGLLR